MRLAKELARQCLADERDTTTPLAMATLLAKIWRREALGPKSTEVLLSILARVETGVNRIKGGSVQIN